ncbi:pyridoxal phosphate-dependent decarboxylase family protein [Bacillus paralicheniformis]|uniref:Siderophore biosynthesis L-24-diaminobutyrate decarboxylase n=1 Tax=Bacillus paralicheniformis TaxID=1648923 RepID=A0A7Z1B4E7_9BACI|nr:aminotransferase class I/II-fold pyridoxal phosphate-dependent enzyme [Bacillus paralicheniformis]MBL7477252.1 aminotransferase class I/II-fold pyridoxal phosphate-dependent enzyme [Bacillus paralicheniformis]MCW4364699.1 aminotransferase class I/II-fold pyridoxal phosphate-dependent enzyme [Bacillus paralicheniformis]OLF93828.1 Siderophore biosynthesis L-24-diaminobutyrate decarboxylase [Bacillus paralicheniformis]RZV63035.1 aminotransferase class I/II-fold pyridoxal phosphate-dependent enz
MKLSFLPSNTFIDPNGQNIKEISILVDQIVKFVIEHASNAGNHRTLPSPESSHYGDIPETGIELEELLKKLQAIVKNSMNPLGPNYMGHMDSIPTLMSCLGEFVSTSINNNMLSLEMSPVFSKMEVQLLGTIARMFGYDDNSGGVMTSGGSLANLQALAAARNNQLKVKESGLFGLSGQPVIFASDVSHTSLHKAAMLLGLGTSSVIPVKSSSDSKMDLDDLRKKIKQAKNEGKIPFAIAATAGTTVTGSIDPIRSIADIAKENGLWLHVDAAYGGALIFSETYRDKLNGIEMADSITFNPQKWMYIAKTCAMVLFKNHGVLETDCRISAPYMNETAFANLDEISVQGTRHADILKLYLSLQHIGLKGYRELLHESLALKDEFTKQVKQRHYLELSSEPDTNVVCFRGIPHHLDEAQWDNWNLELQQFLLNEENVFFSLPAYRGNRWLRAVLLNPFISNTLIQRVFEKIDQFYDQGISR